MLLKSRYVARFSKFSRCNLRLCSKRYNYQCVAVDKETKEAIRESALEKHQEKLRAESKSKAAKKQADKKYALESMMKVRVDDTQSCLSRCFPIGHDN